MPNIQVRDVPDDVHAALVRKARQRGQSLQQYLTEELEHLASTATNAEIFDRISARGGGARLSSQDAVAALEAARAERDAQLRR
jgi:hypothetical protein